ncbi:hypothetical protein RGUI_0442 [Rhodovulum sp. P5]|uniref:ASCH domain-containing protein n=1 Tax=Rhodovulum sp. P5 TaxID=1564506 RepID=UPI0009C293CB|nr:ASCH domain-containing protein [Rhodovulum sp. P5]ARE38583.1 hypothetical protein RGUI_0442 [Rhodovulum sp. P5]
MTLDDALDRFPGALAYRPGMDAEQNVEMLELIRTGVKTAGCAVLSQFDDSSQVPQEGCVEIALDWTGRPVVATRTIMVERLRYCDMDEIRVRPQGGYVDLDDWQREYSTFFVRNDGFDSEAEMVMRHFKVIEDFKT